MKVCIIIPAYNEEKRIARTLKNYIHYFEVKKAITFELLVVLNGCQDNTQAIVNTIALTSTNVRSINIEQAGKGIALTAGFKDALSRSNDYIGFVDADMSTEPHYFCDLINNISFCDGIIASRYMQGAQVFPQRPWIKYWGSKLIYDKLVLILFGMYFYDFQCGAKLFKRYVIEQIIPHCSVEQWAFDIELLYLSKKNGFIVKEIPTVWHDQAGSKLNIFGSGIGMLGALIKLRMYHSPFSKLINRQR